MERGGRSASAPARGGLRRRGGMAEQWGVKMAYRGEGGGIMVACWKEWCAMIVGAIEDRKTEDEYECEYETSVLVRGKREKGPQAVTSSKIAPEDSRGATG